jgi:hypothetical protein
MLRNSSFSHLLTPRIHIEEPSIFILLLLLLLLEMNTIKKLFNFKDEVSYL